MARKKENPEGDGPEAGGGKTPPPKKKNVLDREELDVELAKDYITIKAKPHFVAEVKAEADAIGLSLSAFIRMACINEMAHQRKRRGDAN